MTPDEVRSAVLEIDRDTVFSSNPGSRTQHAKAACLLTWEAVPVLVDLLEQRDYPLAAYFLLLKIDTDLNARTALARLDPKDAGKIAILRRILLETYRQGFEADRLHDEACAAGRNTYRDPVTGHQVLTQFYLEAREYCCKSGCRHCPYGYVPPQPKVSE